MRRAPTPLNSPRLRSVGAALLLLLAALPLGCGERRVVPERPAPPEPTEATPAAAPVDPGTLLDGGELTLEDAFDQPRLAGHWKTSHAGWIIVDGWVHSKNPKNEGLWLTELLPEGDARVEFDVRSEPTRQPYSGDVKCEIFAAEPKHEAGYIIINGGWGNKLDVIARADEHEKGRLQATADKVEASVTYHWAIVWKGDTIYWFRDGELRLKRTDPSPIRGRYFGFNNWESHVYYDNLRVYRL